MASILEEQSQESCCSEVLRQLSVERVAVANLPTAWGDFRIAGYRSLNSDEEFVALFKGELRRDTPTLVRIKVGVDRKSTRLNSSHVRISYAVFCLKKKSRLVRLRARSARHHRRICHP